MSNNNPNINTSRTQREEIEALLRLGWTLTAAMAQAHIGCARLASRIDELRKAGMPIETRMIRVPNRNGKMVSVAEYYLADSAVAA
jgi:hypothetical protein